MNLEKAVRFMSRGFNKILNKVNVISAENGFLKAEFQVTENETNEHGLLHAGFSATVVDVFTSVALRTLYTQPINFVSVQMNFSFIQPSRIGDQIILETKVTRKGRALAFLDAELRNKETLELLVKDIIYQIDHLYQRPKVSESLVLIGIVSNFIPRKALHFFLGFSPLPVNFLSLLPRDQISKAAQDLFRPNPCFDAILSIGN